MKFLRDKIKYVVYVIKENRTYDQVLGDLPVGNGDPELTLFAQPITPNHHQLSLDFVTFDNFYYYGTGQADPTQPDPNNPLYMNGTEIRE